MQTKYQKHKKMYFCGNVQDRLSVFEIIFTKFSQFSKDKILR